MPMIEISCPIRDITTKTLPRCPCRVRGTYAAKASDESGRVLEFFNTSIGGDSIAYYADSHQTETHPGHLCFTDGIRRYADEACSGGIVIRMLIDQPE